MNRIRMGALLACQAVAMLVLLVLAAPGAMAAEGDRVLDPELSLTGACNVDALDEVKDPGCPYSAFPDGPSGAFSDTRAVTTDAYGNIYVASFGSNLNGTQGRIDIFDSDGFFITEVKTTGPSALAVDTEGYLYVTVKVGSEFRILRFEPDTPYEPEVGNIGYSSPPVSLTLAGPECPSSDCQFRSSLSAGVIGLDINPENNHLFANFGGYGIAEFTSAADGNEEVRSIFGGSGQNPGIEVDDARDRLYASVDTNRIDIFDLTSVVGTPPNDEYEKIGTIDGSETPAGKFGVQLSVTVDEGTGHVFILDGENTKLYEFDENHKYLKTIVYGFQRVQAGQIRIDNGPFSPNGALSPTKGRYLYVPSHKSGTGHSFAFFESKGTPPDVKSAEAANVSEDEAELRALINPGNLDTAYTLEFKAEGASSWTLAGQGTIPAGNLDVEVSAAVAGLTPGTPYDFRVFAENEEGSDEADGSFATYPSVPVAPVPCANALLRTGPSALLPDCRAYELVTPADTNGRAPLGTAREPGAFVNRQVSPTGGKVPFKVEGGSIPGLGGTGSQFGDPYVSSRTSTGWSTAYAGPSAAFAPKIVPGTTSPDQGYSFWSATGSTGPALIGGQTSYVRFPDGHSELVGQGTLGTDPKAQGQLISEGGEHIIFSTGVLIAPHTAVQLEPDAAPDKTQAVYDRVPNPETGERETKVISLKPGDVPFGAGEHAEFLGASLDGEGIAFEVGATLYHRYDNEATFLIGTGIAFAGVAEGGRRVFYVEAGDLKRFEVGADEKVFADTAAPVVPVQVSLDGTAAYFVSESAIAGSGPNPAGDQPQPGAQNLYLSEEGEYSFVGTVTDRDVEGEEFVSGTGPADGLGLWVTAANAPYASRFGLVPARTTPDGSALLFKSRAPLTDYDPEGYAQIYRFDSVDGELKCLSCNPTGAAPSSDATLQSERREGSALFHSLAWIENLRADGRRAFFESSEPLVPGDTDGLKDVYEWEGNGVGSCAREGGCLYLISWGQSMRNEYLWAVSPSGDDVFFLSSDLLVGSDTDQTPSIYDARVGGGFPEPVAAVCDGEGCRPHQQPAPPPLKVLSPVLGPGDQVKPGRRCGKGKRKVKRGGKTICVKKKQRSKRRAGSRQRGGRR